MSGLGKARDVSTGIKQSSGIVYNAVSQIVQESNKDTFESRTKFVEVRLEEVMTRPVNQYSQTRIERLAKSIKDVGLIHPIVLIRIEDVPYAPDLYKECLAQGFNLWNPDGSVVEQGEGKYKYIISAGERRFRAWELLRQKELQESDGSLGAANRYKTILCRILTKEEAPYEKQFYDESNTEARTPAGRENLRSCLTALEETKSNEQKRARMVEMNNGSEEGIPENAYDAARKFNKQEYLTWYFNEELGIDIAKGTIKKYLAVINQCDSKVVSAIIDNGIISVDEAARLTKFDKETQAQALELYKEDKLSFNEFLKEKDAKLFGDKTKKRVTHNDAYKCVEELSSYLNRERNKFAKVAEGLGGDDGKRAKELLRQLDTIINALPKYKEQFQ